MAENQLEAARQQREELIQQGRQELDAARKRAKELEQKVQDAAYGLMDEMM